MGQDEELLGPDPVHHHPGHLGRIHAGRHRLGQEVGDELLVLGELGGQSLRPVALGVEDVGVDHPGTQSGGPELGSRGHQVVGQGLGGGEGGELGDGVGRLERGSEEPGHRGRVDDVAFGVLGQHPGHEGPDPVQDAPQIGPEDELEVLGGPVPDQPADEHAGVVADHVHLAPPLEHRVGQGVHLSGSLTSQTLSHRLHRRDTARPALRATSSSEGLLVEVGQRHLHPLGGEGQGECPPDPAPRPGDHGQSCLGTPAWVVSFLGTWLADDRRGSVSARQAGRIPGAPAVVPRCWARNDPTAAMLWSDLGDELGREGLEHVDELRPHRQCHGPPGRLDPGGQIGGVVEEHLVGSDLDEHRGKAAQIGEQG